VLESIWSKHLNLRKWKWKWSAHQVFVKLLQDVVVTYCGNPVGTMAANDPNDSSPLNYDQVKNAGFCSVELGENSGLLQSRARINASKFQS
jgi:hypothetical protein